VPQQAAPTPPPLLDSGQPWRAGGGCRPGVPTPHWPGRPPLSPPRRLRRRPATGRRALAPWTWHPPPSHPRGSRLGASSLSTTHLLLSMGAIASRRQEGFCGIRREMRVFGVYGGCAPTRFIGSPHQCKTLALACVQFLAATVAYAGTAGGKHLPMRARPISGGNSGARHNFAPSAVGTCMPTRWAINTSARWIASYPSGHASFCYPRPDPYELIRTTK
jgi:hypothetical protein